jgi:hypothetical protein
LVIAVGVALSALALYARWEFFTVAGGLWRDEVNSVNVACEARWEQFREATRYDSFALLWQGLTRLWAGLGFCDDDRAWRILGLLLGIGQVASLWVAARQIGIVAPFWSLLLYGANAVAVTYGSSVRGYGLGALAVSLTFAFTVSFVRTESLRAWCFATIASLAAVQVYLPNGVVAAAVHGVAALVFLLRRRSKQALAILSSTGISALSLLANRDWIEYAFKVGSIEQRELAWRSVLEGWSEVFGAPPLLLWTWTAGVPVLLALPLVQRRTIPAAAELPPWFAAASSCAVWIAYSLYLHSVARLGGLPWYYLAPAAVLALAADLACAQSLRERPQLATVCCGVLVALGLAISVPLRSSVRMHLTNVDRLAKLVTESADEMDFVLVTPWYAGITFQRYYGGQAPWNTVPPLDEHRYHLHLQIRTRMQEGDAAVEPVIRQIEATLRRGGKVWLVGVPALPDENEPPPTVPGNPGPRASAGRYLDAWEKQVALFLYQHARDARIVRHPDSLPVSPHERLSLMRLEGWRD